MPMNPVIFAAPQPVVAKVIGGLTSPWAIAFLPSGNLLVTQRDLGLLTFVSPFTSANTIVPNVVSTGGDGGLMGIAVDPDYRNNGFIYLVQTVLFNGGYTKHGNEVVRYVYDQTNHTVVKSGTLCSYDSNKICNGGAIKFGSDGKLFVSTGDAENPLPVTPSISGLQNVRTPLGLRSGAPIQSHPFIPLAQDTASLNGKILRMERDGSAPSDNPFSNVVWAYGLRNPVGMTWQASNLWTTDAGPGFNDKINLIVRGGNYGWPSGDPTIASSLSSGANEVWQVGGIAFYGTSLYFGSLGGVYPLNGTASVNKCSIFGSVLGNKVPYFASTYGRIKDCIIGPDNSLWFTTSNGDGDDSIYRVLPP